MTIDVTTRTNPVQQYHLARIRGWLGATAIALTVCVLAAPRTTYACGAPRDARRAAAAPATALSGQVLDGAIAALAREAEAQRRFWGPTVPAKLYLFDDGDNPNAYAYTSGEIRFGKKFIEEHLGAHGQIALEGTLAHEWAHRIQMTGGWWGTAKPGYWDELEADAIAGYYLARAKGLDWGRIREYWVHMVSLGDDEDPSHHGSRSQRVAATYVGVQLARWHASSGTNLNYQQIHAMLMPKVARIVQTVR